MTFWSNYEELNSISEDTLTALKILFTEYLSLFPDPGFPVTKLNFIQCSEWYAAAEE